jgi:hypothetical protein
MLKHVGKMKNNSARVAVVFRTLPGDVHSALVVGTHGLGDMYHDNLMSVLESDSGQQANELADVLAVRKFPDGENMLDYLHSNGHLKKVPTGNVLMTPDNKTQVPLHELNQIIAEQKGIALEALNPTPESLAPTSKDVVASGYTSTAEAPKTETKTVSKPQTPAKGFELTPEEMRNRATALQQEAARLLKEADAQDPKPKLKKSKTEA